MKDPKDWKTFENEDLIPEIPITTKEKYLNEVIPNIIRCGGIPKDKLEIGKLYLGHCRNATKGRWNGKRFDILRFKFGDWIESTVQHFEDGADNKYDVFVPIKVIEE